MPCVQLLSQQFLGDPLNLCLGHSCLLGTLLCNGHTQSSVIPTFNFCPCCLALQAWLCQHWHQSCGPMVLLIFHGRCSAWVLHTYLQTLKKYTLTVSFSPQADYGESPSSQLPLHSRSGGVPQSIHRTQGTEHPDPWRIHLRHTWSWTGCHTWGKKGYLYIAFPGLI